MTDMPLEHVRREQPPWRHSAITECGLPVAGHPVITRDAFTAKIRAQGQQRAAITTCMTCWSSASRNRPWSESPVESLAREAERHVWASASRSWHPDTDRFRDELLAIAELISRHEDEFGAIVGSLGDTVRLDSARAQRRQRGAR